MSVFWVLLAAFAGWCGNDPSYFARLLAWILGGGKGPKPGPEPDPWRLVYGVGIGLLVSLIFVLIFPQYASAISVAAVAFGAGLALNAVRTEPRASR